MIDFLKGLLEEITDRFKAFFSSEMGCLVIAAVVLVVLAVCFLPKPEPKPEPATPPEPPPPDRTASHFLNETDIGPVVAVPPHDWDRLPEMNPDELSQLLGKADAVWGGFAGKVRYGTNYEWKRYGLRVEVDNKERVYHVSIERPWDRPVQGVKVGDRKSKVVTAAGFTGRDGIAKNWWGSVLTRGEGFPQDPSTRKDKIQFPDDPLILRIVYQNDQRQPYTIVPLGRGK